MSITLCEWSICLEWIPHIGPWSSCCLTSHGEWSLRGRVWTVRADRQSYGKSAGKDKYYNIPITLEANSPVLSALFNMQGFWSKGRSSAKDPVGEGWGGWPWQRLQGHCFGIYWPWLWCGYWTTFYSESATHSTLARILQFVTWHEHTDVASFPGLPHFSFFGLHW